MTQYVYSVAQRASSSPALVRNALTIALQEIEDLKDDLRDRFAMAALTGLLTADKCYITSTTTAEAAYRVADQMMLARAAKGKQSYDL